MNHVSTHTLANWLDDTLQAGRFKDYCPNGLQVEGRDTIQRIVTGVTVSQALLEHAVARGADAVLAHHGWFWKNEDPRVRGPKRRRLALALANELNIFAYHLPLDAHPELGNNAQLARVLGLTPDRDDTGAPLTCGPGDLVWLGTCPAVATLGDLATSVSKRLHRAPLTVGDLQRPVRRVAWCTGAAQSMMDAAIEAGADAYITGEVSEPTFHLANETGVGFISAGHHATERYGIQALGQAIAQQFGIDVEFVDLDNPV
ncbi:Nif3-like dinuclear metal center hexameric protein [Paracandidimonas lactea]|uniref:Nif3-like dinuclear metal center hexameric protein n=1 Tax=Paracandidimonas lactea TaxID=2895524 RepID=UPI001EFFA145|nr:Nif3-like dinuclear metal center hexameric protein [Paracandidimonas lactea]